MSSLPIINAFNAGEFSRHMDGRTDHEKYYSACRRLENFIVRPHGSAFRRSGFRFIYEAKDSSKKVRLFSFDFNSTASQSYIIEMGALYLRFYMDGGIILNAGSPYEVVAPWTEDQIWDVQLVQSADTIYFAHKNVQPQKLTRTGHTAWTLTPITFTGKPATWTGTNWPAAVGIYENRTVWGGAPDKPLSLNFSKTADWEDLTTGALDDEGFELVLSGSRVNPIKWILDQEELLVGTNASEIKVWSGVEGEPITPTQYQSKRQSSHGSKAIQAQLVSNAVLFVSRSGRQIHELSFNWEEYKYKAPDITKMAEHVTGTGVKDMAYARDPDGLLWCAREDGGLACCTYLREEGVFAWHRHPVGGSGSVESVAVIPGDNGDELWIAVNRTINGATKRYVERLDPKFEPDDDTTTAEDGFFVDSGLTYDGAAATEISGLAHVEGCKVQILSDGAVQPVQTVTGGKITLRKAAAKVQVGLKYESLLQPMKLEVPTQQGTSQTQKKRVVAVSVRFLDSIGGKVCPGNDDADKYEEIKAVRATWGENPQLHSEDKTVQLSSGYDKAGLFTVKQDKPLPMTVICCVPEITG